jgi:hypothetical protein
MMSVRLAHPPIKLQDPEAGPEYAFPTLPLTYRPNSSNNNSQILSSLSCAYRYLILKRLADVGIRALCSEVLEEKEQAA